jgi:glycosyltransferase involved in cell wall biosynthesis
MIALREAPFTGRLDEMSSEVSGVLSVIVPVLSDTERAVPTFQQYRAALEGHGFELEFIYVLDRSARQAMEGLQTLKAMGAPLKVIVLSRWDGEVSALKSGFRHARGETFMLLPMEVQTKDGQLAELLHALGSGCDMAIGCRVLHERSWYDHLLNTAFHGLIRALFGRAFKDLACRVRACRRQVLEEILSHSTQHQFLPLLATDRGFEVCEVPLKTNAAQDNAKGFGRLHLGAKVRLVLDACALYLVLNYIRKPIRFFGAIGLPILALGVLFAGFLTFSRFWFEIGLADRPALILAVLLIVLGIQVIVLGLIGEIIIFASGRRMKDYTIDRII